MSVFNADRFLRDFQDLDYKATCERNVFTKYEIIGVRVAIIKKRAKAIIKSDYLYEFLNNQDFKSYDEMILYAYVLNDYKDFKKCIKLAENLLKKTDNWSVCDTLKPKIFGLFREEVAIKVDKWLKSNKIYMVRFAILVLLRHFLNDLESLEKVHSIKSNNYYINMARAWFFTASFTANYDITYDFVIKNKLDKDTFNMMYEKCYESKKLEKEKRLKLKELRKAIFS